MARRFLTAGAAALFGAGAQAQPVPRLPVIEAIVVNKAQRTIALFAGGRLVWTIGHIQLGPQPEGAKHFLGDGRTPEGRYRIDRANPDSAYHLALHISYPSPADLAFARAAGRKPGGAVFIHGQPNDWPAERGRAPGDWTEGCIAVGNDEIEALWQAVPDGTPIEIRP